VLARARRGEAIPAVADKWSLPTFTKDLSDWICRLAPREDATGVAHACQGGEPASWCDWARATLQFALEAGSLAGLPEVDSVSLAGHPGFRAVRPVHSAMATDRLTAWLGEAPRPWREALREHLLAAAAAQRREMV
jgi:dTDP-4-dehydrorhamnose reductase